MLPQLEKRTLGAFFCNLYSDEKERLAKDHMSLFFFVYKSSFFICGSMSDQEFVQVGCMRCKRSNARKVQKTLDMIMEPAFRALQQEAKANGIVIPDTFHEKMVKWSRKNGLLEPEQKSEDAKDAVVAARNALD